MRRNTIPWTLALLVLELVIVGCSAHLDRPTQAKRATGTPAFSVSNGLPVFAPYHAQDAGSFFQLIELSIGQKKRMSMYAISVELLVISDDHCKVAVVDHRNHDRRFEALARQGSFVQFSDVITNRLVIGRVGRRTVKMTLYSYPVTKE